MEKCFNGLATTEARDYENRINQLVYLSAKALASADKLYGLTDDEIKIVEKS